MSAIGPKQMPKNATDVTIGGKADIGACNAHVCFRPKADISDLTDMPSCTAHVRFQG
jgi:hypothetical protein